MSKEPASGFNRDKKLQNSVHYINSIIENWTKLGLTFEPIGAEKHSSAQAMTSHNSLGQWEAIIAPAGIFPRRRNREEAL